MIRYLLYIFPNEKNHTWVHVPYWLSRFSYLGGRFEYSPDDHKAELIDKRQADAGVEWLNGGVLNTYTWDLRIKEG